MLKASELKEMPRDKLMQMARELKQEAMNMRFQKAYDQLKNPSRMRFVRRDIARVYTELSARSTNGDLNV